MGCGASATVQQQQEEDVDEPPWKPATTLKTIKAGNEELQLVVDDNGNKALVKYLDDDGELTVYTDAIKRADAAAAAAAKGALRSSMKHPSCDTAQLSQQARVCKLSLQPREPPGDGESGPLVRLRLAPT